MSRRLRIALLIDASRGYRRNLLRGIAAYARVHGPWSFYHHELALGKTLPAQLKNWQGDGVIVRTDNPKVIEELRRRKLPTVGRCGSEDFEEIPAVDSDYGLVVQLAVDHLLEHGFKHFAYCGFSGASLAQKKAAECFLEYTARLGFSGSVYEDSRLARVAKIASMEKIQHRGTAVAAWIRSLPKPVGVMGYNDRVAHQVLTACSQEGIAVPDEVAVIGVDNDDVLCELSDPPLSSVDPNARRIGYELAALLDRTIRGEPLPIEPTLIKPLGVVARESTDIAAVTDCEAAAAMRFIRHHAASGIQVGDVCRHVRLSRRTLERRFAASFGHSPGTEIMRVQLGRVKDLLATTDLPLEKIAAMSGFNYVESMCHRFKKATGLTPGQYRQELQVE